MKILVFLRSMAPLGSFMLGSLLMLSVEFLALWEAFTWLNLGLLAWVS